MNAFWLRLFFSHLAVAVLVLALAPWDAARDRLAVCVLAGLAGAAIFAGLLARSQARRARECVQALAALAEGETGVRLWLEPSSGLGEVAGAVNDVAAAVETRTRSLACRAERMESVLGGMREGLMVLDRSGRILTVNKAFEDMFRPVQPCQGRRPIEVVASPELQNACDTVVNWADRTRRAAVSIEIEPGGARTLDVSLVRPGQAQAQAELGAVVVFHDLTEIRRMDKVRRDFVANVSHELRTPLTSIKGYAETLLAEADGREGPGRRFLEVILKNANHMSKMVDDLLSLARIENGREPATDLAADALVAFRAAQAECAPLATQRRVRIECSIEEPGPSVRADSGQLAQVFRNLLENAIKYGPEAGQVLVSHRREPQMHVFRVEDMGPGVSESERQRVFERFYRSDRPRIRGEGGTGLGLAIAKHIVDRHGGRIWVEPAQGEMTGAAFCFTIPEASAPKSSQGPTA